MPRLRNIEKANDRPIDGTYEGLARELRRLLGHEQDGDRPYLSSREASRVTGVNHATITTTVRGDRPSEGTILKLAKGLNGDAGRLLSLAGYHAGRYLREDQINGPPHSEQGIEDQAAPANQEGLIKRFADFHRLGRGADLVGLLNPASGYSHTAVTGHWEAYALPVLVPLLPYTTRGHYALVAGDYLRALEEGDGEVMDMEQSFRGLLLNASDWRRPTGVQTRARQSRMQTRARQKRETRKKGQTRKEHQARTGARRIDWRPRSTGTGGGTGSRSRAGTRGGTTVRAACRSRTT